MRRDRLFESGRLASGMGGGSGSPGPRASETRDLDSRSGLIASSSPIEIAPHAFGRSSILRSAWVAGGASSDYPPPRRLEYYWAMAAEEQVAFELFDLTQQEAEAIADVLAIAEVLFPGLRKLTEGFEGSVPVLRDYWYNAPTHAHRDTIVFARYLHDALLPAVQGFYREHKAQFSLELARVYGNDVTGFSRAVAAYYGIAIKKGSEEIERAAALSSFVFSQPGLRENVARMRLEYEEGRRTKFSEADLGQKRD